MNERTLRSRSRLQDAVGLGVICALCAGVYVVGFRPAALERLASEQLIARVRQLRSHHDVAVGSPDRLRVALHDSSERLAASRVRLLPMEAKNQRLSDLTSLATSHGMVMDSVVPGATSRSLHHTGVTITLDGRGDVTGVVSLLHDLKTRFPDIGVRALTITRDERSPTTSQARVRLEMVWFVLDDSRQSGS